MNLITFFNYRLAVVAQLGYARTVQFTPLPGHRLPSASLHSSGGITTSRSEGERSARLGTSRQIQRTNRHDLTPNRRHRLAYQRQYRAAKKAAQATLFPES